MNSGLPSLLDAIFGKQNLDSVSLDEIYELINEFPSFNAGHFLLSKKLKEHQEAGYEKETMRTALYFNNPFWLESVLNEEDHLVSARISPSTYTEPVEDFPTRDSFIDDSETNLSEIRFEEFTTEPEPLSVDEPSSVQSRESQDSSKEEIHAEENTELLESFQDQPQHEYTEGPVKSFDDLISKYHIESINTSEETFVESPPAAIPPLVDTIQAVEHTDVQSGNYPPDDQESGEIAEDYEIREEVFNEYGIFEEVRVKKTDFDLEAFDRPVTNVPENNTSPSDPVTEVPAAIQALADVPSLKENTEDLGDRKEESSLQEAFEEAQTQADYEAFDPPDDHQIPEETETLSDFTSEEESITEIFSGQELRLESVESQLEADDTEADETAFGGSGSDNGQMSHLSDSIGEQQKRMTPFDPKKAESIVFAPYHMIDYFASQGIKLVLEDNPADPFARQLKSFTDWLKVMKKLPAQTLTEKTDEKETDRIRHFAAHSIDEREILTESMAEVLAKQGMYENAIALFQKLSLIYPPKSAYFASRIEQIKASLP